MCVVTVLPLSGGFVLTANRDEHTSRPQAIPPRSYRVDSQTLVFPKDPQGGGTWLASSGATTVCLLNGAFGNHAYKPPYRKSRGLVVLDYFGYDSPLRFADAYDFAAIEPFTMVVVSHADSALAVHELRWNGQQIYLRDLPADRPHIWSSVTLYSEPMAELRKTWLVNFLYKHPQFSPDDLFIFHQTAGDGNPQHDFIMDRPQQGVRTVSVTQVSQTGAEQTMRYLDLPTKIGTQQSLALLGR